MQIVAGFGPSNSIGIDKQKNSLLSKFWALLDIQSTCQSSFLHRMVRFTGFSFGIVRHRRSQAKVIPSRTLKICMVIPTWFEAPEECNFAADYLFNENRSRGLPMWRDTTCLLS